MTIKTESDSSKNNSKDNCNHKYEYVRDLGIFSQIYKCTKCGETYIEFD